MANEKELIAAGKAILGIEFGSTRIKAVLIDEAHKPIAQGAHDWENRLDNGIWTYTLDDIWGGLTDCYAKLAADVEKQYGEKLTRVAAMGISAMMHGYMAFDEKGELWMSARLMSGGIITATRRRCPRFRRTGRWLWCRIRS